MKTKESAEAANAEDDVDLAAPLICVLEKSRIAD